MLYGLGVKAHRNGCRPDKVVNARDFPLSLDSCCSFGKVFPVLFIAASITILFLSSVAQAQTAVAQVIPVPLSTSFSHTQEKPLIVGSEQDYPPFATGMTDAEAGGFTVDLWKAVAAEVGLKYTIRVQPFRKTLQSFKEGRTDVLINLARSEERRQFANFTVPHVVVNGAIFVRNGDSGIHTEDDLAAKSIIVLNADLAHDYALTKGWGKHLVLVDTTAEGFQLLASGKHDAMLIGKLPGMQTLLALGLTDIKALKVKVGFSQKFGFAVHKSQSDLLEKINEGLAITKANGTYDRLYEKWFGLYEVKEIGLSDMLKYFTPIILFFLAIGGYFFYRRQVERKQAETKLWESEVRLSMSLKGAELGTWSWYIPTGHVNFSERWAEMRGYRLDEVEPNVSSWQKGICPDDLPDLEKMLTEHFEGRIPLFDTEYRVLNKTGQWIWILDRGTVIERDPDGKPLRMTGIEMDITKRKEAEGMLRTLSRAIDQAGESVIITDAQGIIEYVNPSFTRITGYTDEEVLGKTPQVLKSGKQNKEYYERLWSTISIGKVWHSAVVDRRKDGSEYHALMTISPILNNGQITHYVGTQQDMTEYEALEEQFLQAQKMESLGTLVGGIAHDFNNMLAGITGNLYLAKKRASELPDVVEKLDTIESISFRAADMIQQLLSFARKSRVEIKPFPLTPFIKETLKFLHSSIPENITVHQNIGIDPLLINGDSTQLHQVLMNLVNNARDALECADNPCITIKLNAFHADDKFDETHPDLNAGEYAHLSVEDNGEGISESAIGHLFEPFFTTKEQGKGTGLGLSMVFGAVQTHQGAIDVESKIGQGTTFHVYLPLLESAEIEPAPMEQEAAEGRGELILLVDDQESIIDMGQKVLASLGYKVLTATNGQQAIEMYQAHADEIDLIIMDVVMPIMGGSQATQIIRQINPQVKIIFSTGYDKGAQAHMENETVIAKPFPIIQMSYLIRQQLDL